MRDHFSLPNSALLSATDGAARIFSYHSMLQRDQSDDMLWFKSPSVELHQTGTLGGCSTDWATTPRLILKLLKMKHLSFRAKQFSAKIVGLNSWKNNLISLASIEIDLLKMKCQVSWLSWPVFDEPALWQILLDLNFLAPASIESGKSQEVEKPEVDHLLLLQKLLHSETLKLKKNQSFSHFFSEIQTEEDFENDLG